MELFPFVKKKWNTSLMLFNYFYKFMVFSCLQNIFSDIHDFWNIKLIVIYRQLTYRQNSLRVMRKRYEVNSETLHFKQEKTRKFTNQGLKRGWICRVFHWRYILAKINAVKLIYMIFSNNLIFLFISWMCVVDMLTFDIVWIRI